MMGHNDEPVRLFKDMRKKGAEIIESPDHFSM